MNKQQFITELSQYLNFASLEEQSAILSYYKNLLETASEEEESEILSQLGTPMKLALCLRRRKDSGEDLSHISDTCADDEEDLPAEVSAEHNEEQSADENQPVSEVINEECTSTDQEPNIDECAEVLEEDNGTTELCGNSEAKSEDDIFLESACEDKKEATVLSEDETVPSPSKEKNTVTAGYVFKAIGAVLLSIIIIALSLPFMAGAIFLLASMGNFIIAGLTSLHYTVEALMLFGGAFLLGAPGLLILWFFIWADIKLMSKIFSGLKR